MHNLCFIRNTNVIIVLYVLYIRYTIIYMYHKNVTDSKIATCNNSINIIYICIYIITITCFAHKNFYCGESV